MFLRFVGKQKDMGIKVLLGGAGGDDFFSGYRRHQAAILNYKLRFLPKLMQLFHLSLKSFLVTIKVLEGLKN